MKVESLQYHTHDEVTVGQLSRHNKAMTKLRIILVQKFKEVILLLWNTYIHYNRFPVLKIFIYYSWPKNTNKTFDILVKNICYCHCHYFITKGECFLWTSKIAMLFLVDIFWHLVLFIACYENVMKYAVSSFWYYVIYYVHLQQRF